MMPFFIRFLVFIAIGLLAFAVAAEEIPQAVMPTESGGPLLAPSIDEAASGQPSAERVEPAVFDSGAMPPLRWHPTPTWAFGARLGLNNQTGRNVDLTGSEPGLQQRDEMSLNLAASYRFTERVKLFAEVGGTLKWEADQDRSSAAKIDRAYLQWKGLFTPALTLQLGRQRLADGRQWLYDENLDAIRLLLNQDKTVFEFSASTRLDPQNSKEKIKNYLLRADYLFNPKNRAGVYILQRHDPMQKDNDLVYTGVSWAGRLARDHKAWLETAYLAGENGSRRRRGYAYDLGTTFVFGDVWQPSVTLAYARGSGDRNRNDDIDATFRQTGIEDNEARFNGITKFKYYGLVTDPELSNLQVATLGLGLTRKKKFSLDLVYHRYEQVVASTRFRSKPLVSPAGREVRLGSELDLVLGMRFSEQFNMRLVGGLFRPGAAFADDTKESIATELELRYSF